MEFHAPLPCLSPAAGTGSGVTAKNIRYQRGHDDLGFAFSDAHDTALSPAAVQMAVATRAGERRSTCGVIFHSDRGSGVHRGHLRHRLPTPGRGAVDGPGRLGVRQRRRRGRELHEFTSWAFGQRLRNANLLASMGTVGDCLLTTR